MIRRILSAAKEHFAAKRKALEEIAMLGFGPKS